MPRVFLHVGLHKTGTTSIQRWLLNNPDRLAASGLNHLAPRLHKASHVEMGLSTLRPALDPPARRMFLRVNREGILGKTKASIAHVLRNKADWLRSYRQRIGWTGTTPDIDPKPVRYAEPDSWLMNHDRLVERLAQRFDNVWTMQYSSDMLTTFLNLIGVDGTFSDVPRANVTIQPS